MNTYFIIGAIKQALRDQHWTYADLANKMGMSVPGIKKMLTKEDISVGRVLEICQILQLDPRDFWALATAQSQQVAQFTDKQMHFFVKNINYFHFYMHLAYELKSTRQIQKEFALSDRSASKYLKKLEELGLILRHPEGRVQIQGGAPLHVQTHGTLLESEKFRSLERLKDRIENTRQGDLRGGIFFLSEVEKSDLLRDLTALLSNYSIASNRNRRAQNKTQYSTTSLMLLQGPGSLFDQITEL